MKTEKTPTYVEETALSTTGEHDEVEEKMVMIYESADNLGGHSISLNTRRVVTQSTLHQQPGTTFFRTVTMGLGLLCILLLAGIIGIGVHCRIKPQSCKKIGDEYRKPTLVEINHFCKDGCTSFNTSFYYISSEKKSWEDSRQDCKDRGSDLVIVSSTEEQVFINSLNRTFWIGLSDREEEGTWKWVDVSVLNSTGFWEKGEPSGKLGGAKEDCVKTSWPAQQNSWKDNNCTKPHHWICEKVHDF
ncbi:CD209 antigen-like protein E isoform X2 [Xiphias gladius]|uniref:CD209 antigen-like protein E isoform X2 n=1 Tax=Xiphias gladius TaxID=8245 RepID=UPI001A9953CD|nr:CD209 antigen-like protein E isoform X2 [Xiphias gladius]